jgi:hypothetical protein
VARKQLLRALGNDEPAERGWLVAAWYVTYAQKYGLHQVRYDGLIWTAAAGHDGWLKDAKAVGVVQVT